MRYTVTIPGWHPNKLNQLLGNWHKAARLKRASRELILHACRNIPDAKLRRRVTLTIILGKGQRAGDPDAYWKDLLDALVWDGAVHDDNRQWVELAPVQFQRADKPATVIELQDL